MEIIKIDKTRAEEIAPLIADFRCALCSYKGITKKPDINAAREELFEFLDRGFPVYAAAGGNGFAGYIVCRIDEPCVWVEHIFVAESSRRKGIATALFAKAEELAASMGEETVFNYVHPNNGGMISFLRSKGYTVLNMIELRKPYAGEKPASRINVGNNVFDY